MTKCLKLKSFEFWIRIDIWALTFEISFEFPRATHKLDLWASPRSLAATEGIYLPRTLPTNPREL